MSIGILGMAALQLVSVQENASALRQSQANQYAYDMADRMRANRGGLDANAYDAVDTANLPGSKPACKAAGANCTAQQIASLDGFEWKEQIERFPDGKGTVTENPASSGRFLVRVMWDDDVRTGADTRGCPTDTSIDQTCVEIAVEP
jgi:type IV pilus assembly protein PilV